MRKNISILLIFTIIFTVLVGTSTAYACKPKPSVQVVKYYLIKNNDGKLIKMKVEDYQMHLKNKESEYYKYFLNQKYINISHLVIGSKDSKNDKDYKYLDIDEYFSKKISVSKKDEEIFSSSKGESFESLKDNIYTLSFKEGKPIFENYSGVIVEEKKDIITLNNYNIELQKQDEKTYKLDLTETLVDEPEIIDMININGKNLNISDLKVYYKHDGLNQEVMNFSQDKIKYLPYMPIVSGFSNDRNGIKYAGANFVSEIDKVGLEDIEEYSLTNINGVETIKINEDDYKVSEYTIVGTDAEGNKYDILVNILFNNAKFNIEECISGENCINNKASDLSKNDVDIENIKGIDCVDECDNGERPYVMIENLILGEDENIETTLEKEYDKYEEDNINIGIYTNKSTKSPEQNIIINLEKNNDNIEVNKVTDSKGVLLKDSSQFTNNRIFRNKQKNIFDDVSRKKIVAKIDEQSDNEVGTIYAKINDKEHRIGDISMREVDNAINQPINLSLNLEDNEDAFIEPPTIDIYYISKDTGVRKDLYLDFVDMDYPHVVGRIPFRIGDRYIVDEYEKIKDFNPSNESDIQAERQGINYKVNNLGENKAKVELTVVYEVYSSIYGQEGESGQDYYYLLK